MELPLKPSPKMEALRAAVRPLVTLGLVGSFIALLACRGPEIANHLKELVMMAMTFYFLDRSTKKLKESK